MITPAKIAAAYAHRVAWDYARADIETTPDGSAVAKIHAEGEEFYAVFSFTTPPDLGENEVGEIGYKLYATPDLKTAYQLPVNFLPLTRSCRITRDINPLQDKALRKLCRAMTEDVMRSEMCSSMENRAKAMAQLVSEELGHKASKPKQYGEFRYSDQNLSYMIPTMSEEGVDVYVLVSAFEAGRSAIGVFSREDTSELNRFENISTFTYFDGIFDEEANERVAKQMVKDIEWVHQTVDEYKASWEENMDEDEHPRFRA